MTTLKSGAPYDIELFNHLSAPILPRRNRFVDGTLPPVERQCRYAAKTNHKTRTGRANRLFPTGLGVNPGLRLSRAEKHRSGQQSELGFRWDADRGIQFDPSGDSGKSAGRVFPSRGVAGDF